MSVIKPEYRAKRSVIAVETKLHIFNGVKCTIGKATAYENIATAIKNAHPFHL